MKGKMDELRAAKLLRSGRLADSEAEAKELTEAYDYALNCLADMYMIRSVCESYLENNYTAKEAMVQIIKLLKNGEKG